MDFSLITRFSGFDALLTEIELGFDYLCLKIKIFIFT